MAVKNSDLLDLVNVTLDEMGPQGIEVALDQQSSPIVDTLFTKDAVEADSGKQIQRRLILDKNGAAQMILPYQEATINQTDTTSVLTAPWAMARTQWVISRTEVLDNAKGSKLYDILKTKRIPSMISMAELLEDQFVGVPSDSTDMLNAMGLGYWLPKITSAGEGFYGGLPSSSFSNVGGIIPATSGSNTSSIAGGKALWRNYQAGGSGYYTGVMDATAMNTIQRAMILTKFQAPVIAKDLPRNDPSNKYKMLVNTDTFVLMAKRARDQNDNVGFDLLAGRPTVNGVIPTVLPSLDSDTSNPVYILNLNAFKVIVKRGDHFREDEAMNDQTRPDTFVSYVTLAFQIVCTNRRKQAVISAV